MDLFAGCGGMTRGFEDTGRFRAVFAVEWDGRAAETYRRNFGDHVVDGPIEDVPTFPDVDVVIGGPPCQGFSPLNMEGLGWSVDRCGASTSVLSRTRRGRVRNGKRPPTTQVGRVRGVSGRR